MHSYPLSYRKIRAVQVMVLIFMSLMFANCRMASTAQDQLIKPKKLPGVLPIAENLYYDQMEITNSSWLEYMYWVEKVFGKTSEEYIAILPDTAFGLDSFPCFTEDLASLYLRHPHYRNHPVVGISQKQAREYAKWRSDRVFEVMLINKKIIEYNKDQNQSNYFSIDNYFNGTYNNYQPDPLVTHYPMYRLPSKQEYLLAMKFNGENGSKTNEVKEKNSPCIQDSLWVFPTNPSYSYKRSAYKSIKDLNENVREWISDEGVSVGGSWIDPFLTNEVFDLSQHSNTNAWTGFRLVCEIKSYPQGTSSK